MVVDRPDYTDSARLVRRGEMQFESGLALTHEKGVRSLTGGQLLLRIGLSERFELRLGSDGFLSERTLDGEASSGFADAELSAKIRLWRETAHLPAVSLIPILSLPAGSDAFSSGGYDPTLKVAWQKDLRRGVSLGGNVDYSWLTAPEGRFAQWAYSWSLDYDLPRGFAGYCEVFSISPYDYKLEAAWIADAGLIHTIGRNVQVDVLAGRRLTSLGPDWFVGFGFAARRPPGRANHATRRRDEEPSPVNPTGR